MKTKKLTAIDYQKIFDSADFEKQLATVVADHKKKLDGGRYKKTPFANLHADGVLKPETIKKEFLLIGEKKSALSSAKRDVIEAIILLATDLVIEAIEKARAKRKAAREAKKAKTDE